MYACSTRDLSYLKYKNYSTQKDLILLLVRFAVTRSTSSWRPTSLLAHRLSWIIILSPKTRHNSHLNSGIQIRKSTECFRFLRQALTSKVKIKLIRAQNWTASSLIHLDPTSSKWTNKKSKHVWLALAYTNWNQPILDLKCLSSKLNNWMAQKRKRTLYILMKASSFFISTTTTKCKIWKLSTIILNFTRNATWQISLGLKKLRPLERLKTLSATSEVFLIGRV